MKVIVVKRKESNNIVNILRQHVFEHNYGGSWEEFVKGDYPSDFNFQLKDVNLDPSYFVAYKSLDYLL